MKTTDVVNKGLSIMLVSQQPRNCELATSVCCLHEETICIFQLENQCAKFIHMLCSLATSPQVIQSVQKDMKSHPKHSRCKKEKAWPQLWPIEKL